MPPKRRSLGLEVGAYLYARRRARSGKRLRKLFLTLCRSVCRRLREARATKHERLYQADRALCHKIAARHRQSGTAIGGRSLERPGICEVARLKEILEQSLKSITPRIGPSIAAELGYANDGYIRQKFPACARNQQESISDEANSFSENSPDTGRRAQ